jgi:hypothetical protein
VAPNAERSALDQSAMLPLIVGDPEPPATEPQAESASESGPEPDTDVTPPRPDVEDAELAEGNGAPFRR